MPTKFFFDLAQTHEPMATYIPVLDDIVDYPKEQRQGDRRKENKGVSYRQAKETMGLVEIMDEIYEKERAELKTVDQDIRYFIGGVCFGLSVPLIGLITWLIIT